MQGVQRYVLFAYLVIGVLIWTTLTKLFGALAFYSELPNPALIGNNFTLAHLLGLAGAAGAGFYVYKHPAATTFSTDVVTELEKVTWPSRKETQTATVVVIITTILCALILGVFDAVWAQLTGLIYS